MKTRKQVKSKLVDPDTGKPSTAKDAIAYGAYTQRKKVDPDTGKPSTAKDAIAYGVYTQRKKVDPDTGEPSTAKNAISCAAYRLRKKVDPETGKPSTADNAITLNAYRRNKKVDPETGEPSTADNAISYGAYNERKKRKYRQSVSATKSNKRLRGINNANTTTPMDTINRETVVENIIHIPASYLINHLALINDAEAIINLANRGFNFNAIDFEGNSPLLIAVKNDCLLTVEALLQHGADIAQSNTLTGDTVVHIAAGGGQVDIMKRLMQLCSGSLLEKPNNQGITPMQLALQGKHDEVVELLSPYYKQNVSALHLRKHSLFQSKEPTSRPIIPALVPIKEEPKETRRDEDQPILKLNIGELREVVLTLRKNSNASQNCPQLAHDVIDYLKTGKKPTVAASEAPFSLDHFAVDLIIDSVPLLIKKEKRSHKSSKLRMIEAPVRSVIDRNTVFGEYTLPDENYPENDGKIDLTRPPIINVDSFTQKAVHFSQLNEALKQEAEKNGHQVSFGIIDLGRCGKYVDEAGHMFVYYATPSEVIYLDCQEYNGNIQEGDPIFSDVAKIYRLAGMRDGRITINTFTYNIYYAPMGPFQAASHNITPPTLVPNDPFFDPRFLPVFK